MIAQMFWPCKRFIGKGIGAPLRAARLSSPRLRAGASRREILVTPDTQFDDLFVPAGTRLLGLPAPADSQSRPGSVSLMVLNGSTWPNVASVKA